MKCIIGLGNPGRKYKKTRHNIGFMIIDEILSRHGWKLSKSKFSADMTVEQFRGEKVALVQPRTYMNRSGEAIQAIVTYYGISAEDILVIYDDLDLPAGNIRLRKKGGHGGHNGMRSTISHLGTQEFKRLRIGIGRPASAISVVDYVLRPFPKADIEDVEAGIQKAADACEEWVEKPFPEVMNTYNI